MTLCLRALTDSWPSVRTALRHAQLVWLAPAVVCAAASMIGLALQWWRWLRAFGLRTGPVDASAWYLGGELGKYLPGSVWTVLGRGELARRAGVARGPSYASTLLAYGTMCAAAAVVCGIAGPVMALTGGPGWGWAFLPLVALVPALVHPRLLRGALAVGRRLTRGRFEAPVPSWPAMLRLVAWCLPPWLLLGTASLSLTQLLQLNASPPRIVLAAVAAWTVGFLAVPVPAGAGVRELVFVGLCGLPTASGAAIALLSRSSLLLVDAVLGVAGLLLAARRAPRRVPAAAASPAAGSASGMAP
jgi:glycosyltransferase 2 family protein